MLLAGLFIALGLADETGRSRAAPPAEPDLLESHALSQLLAIRRVYVDTLTGGDTAEQIRDMIIASLQNARLFVLTENRERADAILRGSAEDAVFTDVHSSSDNVYARAGVSKTRGPDKQDTGRYNGLSMGESESSRSAERKHEAFAAVRLVNKEGDIIWSTTQESAGAKFRGSSADVAVKITRRLMDDLDRARKLKR